MCGHTHLRESIVGSRFINTGWIFKSNIRIVDEIIDSKKAFIVLSSTGFGLNTEDRFIEMVAVGKKLTNEARRFVLPVSHAVCHNL